MIILVVVGVVPMVLHWSTLSLAGALQVPWRRTMRLIGLGCTLPLLAIAYVSTVGSIVAPPVATPDPRDQAFFAATLALYIVTAITLWPVIEIAATRQAQSLRNYITTRGSQALVQRYLHR